jgi:hypothetical protein
MEKTFSTKFGEISLRGAMIDVNGTDLVEGVEIKLEGELVGEVLGRCFSEVEDMSIKQVEKFVENTIE